MVQPLQQVERVGMHLALRVRAGGEAAEAPGPFAIDDGLGEDRPRRVAGAEKEDVVGAMAHGEVSGEVQQAATATAGRQISGWPAQQSSIRKRIRPEIAAVVARVDDRAPVAAGAQHRRARAP